eukprot:CAMPEP_0170157064 /NCGR_PEP_ID=MMETSP0033_2-20121228/64857_1 /TAXON_ID=195969 /ORGANISM="Dolichomastix tenuilepis, Strain CCMP3274" /LENGTH=110 /DNA_ID=CAMNT_0010394453 /DNA_START=25 /DNA_END=353 /DNA_ORIENTATION=+
MIIPAVAKTPKAAPSSPSASPALSPSSLSAASESTKIVSIVTTAVTDLRLALRASSVASAGMRSGSESCAWAVSASARVRAATSIVTATACDPSPLSAESLRRRSFAHSP